MDKTADSNVKVAVRIRPQLARERIDMCRICTSVTPGEPQVVIGQDKSFTFDYIFDIDSHQQQIYNSCARKLIEGTYEGFNATILAYGQTGSGKTYTMGTAFDLNIENDDQIGIIPRAIEHLFIGIQEYREKALEKGDAPPEFKVNAQFMELYNEEVFDLLDVTRDPTDKNRKSHIKIHEDARGEIYTVGLTTRPVGSVQEALHCLKAGTLSRTTASTNMNAQSSRSHAIFTLLVKHQRIRSIEIEGTDAQSEVEMLSAKFNFVDLAGSERLKRTGATGDRAREGISINCGLLALGNVISALGDEEKRGCHVPYRDSKLTRLLQDSLGGNSNTLMIACISPSDCDFVETLNTLKYANRARNICNKLVANQDTASRQLGSMRAEIQALKQELMEFRMGHRVADAESSNDMLEENSMLKTENINLRQRVRALQETIESLMSRNIQLQSERDRLSLPSGDDSNGEELQKLIEGYVQQTEQLKASLTESQSLIESLQHQSTTSRYSMSSRMASSCTSADLDLSLDPDDHVQSLLHEAKLDVMRLKAMQDSESAHSHTVHKTDDESLPEQPEHPPAANDDSESSDSEPDDDECQKLNEKLADLVGEISIKQKLIDELESSQKRLHLMRAHYEEKLNVLSGKIRETELERDKVLANLAGGPDGRGDGNAKKVKEEYSAKLATMQNELKKLQAAKREHTKLLRNQTHYETQLRTLKNDLTSLKQLKVKLMKQLQEEAQKSRQSEQKSQKAIAQLQKQQRVKDNQIKSLEAEKRQKELVLKRKMEEVSALRRHQKSAMTTKAAGRVSKSALSSHDVANSSSLVACDPRLLKTSWDNLEKLISSVIVRRQTLVHLDRDMERWIKQREAVGKKLDRLLKKHEKMIATEVEFSRLSELNEQIDTLRDNMTYIQDNINECQNSIVHLEEFKGDDMESDNIFLSSSLSEAMYLLEHCTNLAINNGLLAALKNDDCREIEAKYHQEQMENIFQRDMLQYLIQDKVDVEIDHGIIWQDNEDESDSSSCSLSPVDSLENQVISILPRDAATVVTEPEVTCADDSSAEASKSAVPKPSETSVKQPASDSTPDRKTAEKPSPVKTLPPNSRDRSLPRPKTASSRMEQTTTNGKAPKVLASPSPARKALATKPRTLETTSPTVERKMRPDTSPSAAEVSRTVLARGVINAAADAGIQAPPRGSCPMVHCHTAVGHSKAILSVFATGTSLYTGSKDRTAKIWDLTAGVETHSFDSHPTSVVSIKYSELNKLVYTASAYLVKVWDPRMSTCVYTLTSAGLTTDGSMCIDEDPFRPVSCPPGEINIADIALGTSSTSLYTAAGNTVRTWDLRMLRSVGKLYGGHQAAVMALAVSDLLSVRCVVSGSKDRSLKVFHLPADFSGVISPKCSLEPSHSDGIQSLCMLGTVLFSGARDMSIMKWDVSEAVPLKQSIPNAHRDWVCGLSCLQHGGGTMMLSACRAGVLKVWNASTCSLLGEVQAHIGAINCITTDHQTGLAFTGSSDRTVRIWKPVTN